MRNLHLLAIAVVSCVLALFAGMAQAAESVGGLGILGDSASDEFRADDDRGGAYAATTFNWAELLILQRGIDSGPWGSRAEPRRTGYAYNWARSGAVAADLVDTGQATGLAAQIAAGSVSTVVIMVGANDFAIWNGTCAAVYDGTLSGTALAAKIDGIVGSLRRAVEILQAAGTARIFIATLADRGMTPAFQERFPDAAKRQRVTDAIVRVNDGIRQLALERSLVVVDLYAYGSTLLPRIDANGNLQVGGELISFTVPGDEPHHLVLADSEHAGTVASGLLANYFMYAFGAAGLSVTAFTDQEILNNAGIVRPPPDRVAPAVSITSPGADAVVAGTVNVAASASDTVGVTGVQFLLDGNALGAEDVAAPYAVTWNAAGVANGMHVLAARARDAAGNAATASVNVTVRNGVTVRPASANVLQGNLQSGTLSSLAYDDNQYFVLRSATSGLTGYATMALSFGSVARNAMVLDFNVRSKASTSSTSMRISAWNAVTASWVLLGSSTLGTSESTRTSTITSGAANYVDAAGTVRLRIECSRLFSSFSASHELVTLSWR